MIAVLFASMIMAPPRVQVSGIVSWNGKPARDAVVWLEGGGEKIAPLKKLEIRQKDKKFDPHISVVSSGTKVGFPNEDQILHNVFAEYNAKKFDLGLFPKGRSKEVTFDKSGLVAVLCNIHSEMSCFIMVVDSNHFTKTNSKGEFLLKDIPTGEYVLKSWHESRATAKKSIGAAKSLEVSVNLAR